MKGRRGFTLIELLVVIAIIAVLAAILFPVFARARAAAQKSNCESNMKQIGAAFKMYLSDWHDSYPPNRTAAGALTTSVALVVAGNVDSITNKQRVYSNGVNWVEALYQYVEPPAPDSNGAWECKAASNARYPVNYLGVPSPAYTTYAMNYYLVEQPEGVIKQSDRLMLCREMDRHYMSDCRPSGPADPTNPAQPPINTFLCGYDGIGNLTTNSRLHGMGSHILFTDTHVAIFSASAMPQTVQWDATDSQWYNYVTSGSPNIRKRIAINP